MIGGEDGQKMSKSRGNIVNPDDVVEKYGADNKIHISSKTFNIVKNKYNFSHVPPKSAYRKQALKIM